MKRIKIKKEFDISLDYIKKSEIVLIGSQTGDGKSSFKTWMAANAAKNGSNCLYVSFEQKARDVLERAEKAGLDSPKIAGKLSVVEFKLNEPNIINKLCLALDTYKINGSYPDMLFIDNLDIVISSLKKSEHRLENLLFTLQQFIEISREYGTAIIASMQLARNSYNDKLEITYDMFGFDERISNLVDKFLIIKSLRDEESKLLFSDENYHNFNIDIIKNGNNTFLKRICVHYNFSNNYIDFYGTFHKVPDFFENLAYKMNTFGLLVFQTPEIKHVFTSYFINCLLNMKKDVVFCSVKPHEAMLAQISSAENYNYKFTGQLYVHTMTTGKLEIEINEILNSQKNIDYLIVDDIENFKNIDPNLFGIIHRKATSRGTNVVLNSGVRAGATDIKVADISQTYQKVTVANYAAAISKGWPTNWFFKLFQSKKIHHAKVLKDRYSSDHIIYKLKIDDIQKSVKYLKKQKNV